MNLVELYLREPVFPLQKILTWTFEQYIERDMAPIYTYGRSEPVSFSRGPRRARREAQITFVGLTLKEYEMLYKMKEQRKEIIGLRLRCEQGTLYLNKGIIKSLGTEDPGVIPDEYSRFLLTVECIDIAINADPPVTGSEAVIQLGDRETFQARRIELPSFHHTTTPRDDMFRQFYLGHFNSEFSNLDGVADGGDRNL